MNTQEGNDLSISSQAAKSDANSQENASNDSGSTGLGSAFFDHKYDQASAATARQDAQVGLSLGRGLASVISSLNQSKLNQANFQAELDLKKGALDLNKQKHLFEVEKYNDNKKEYFRRLGANQREEGLKRKFTVEQAAAQRIGKASTSFGAAMIKGNRDAITLAERTSATNASKQYGEGASVSITPSVTQDGVNIKMNKSGSFMFTKTIRDKNGKVVSTKDVTLDSISNQTQEALNDDAVQNSFLQAEDRGNNTPNTEVASRVSGLYTDLFTGKNTLSNGEIDRKANVSNLNLLMYQAHKRGDPLSKIRAIKQNYEDRKNNYVSDKDIPDRESTLSDAWSNTQQEAHKGYGSAADTGSSAVQVNNNSLENVRQVKDLTAQLNKNKEKGLGIIKNGMLVYRDNSSKINVTRNAVKLSDDQVKQIVLDKGDKTTNSFFESFKHPVFTSKAAIKNYVKAYVANTGVGFWDTAMRYMPGYMEKYIKNTPPDRKEQVASQALVRHLWKGSVKNIKAVNQRYIKVVDDKNGKIDFFAKNGVFKTGEVDDSHNQQTNYMTRKYKKKAEEYKKTGVPTVQDGMLTQ